MNPLDYLWGRLLYELAAFAVAVVVVIIVFSLVTGYLSGRNR